MYGELGNAYRKYREACENLANLFSKKIEILLTLKEGEFKKEVEKLITMEKDEDIKKKYDEYIKAREDFYSILLKTQGYSPRKIKEILKRL
ncbi:MAG: hypothetical protein DRP72_03625 [Candidatus Omnitrophota bacterium]|nr:MAG: hypothetical protein DRP72_03625 [Candidatus Omnitrophota bacterium]